MRKVVVVALGVFAASILFTMLLGPAEVAVAQGPPAESGRPDDPGRPVGGQALLEALGLAGGSCSITCNDGGTYETDADSTIECACDCASVCGGTCTATNGDEVRTCSET